MIVFDTKYLIVYIIGDYFDAIGKIGKLDNFKALLHNMISINILDEINTVRFNKFH